MKYIQILITVTLVGISLSSACASDEIPSFSISKDDCDQMILTSSPKKSPVMFVDLSDQALKKFTEFTKSHWNEKVSFCIEGIRIQTYYAKHLNTNPRVIFDVQNPKNCVAALEAVAK